MGKLPNDDSRLDQWELHPRGEALNVAYAVNSLASHSGARLSP